MYKYKDKYYPTKYALAAAIGYLVDSDEFKTKVKSKEVKSYTLKLPDNYNPSFHEIDYENSTIKGRTFNAALKPIITYVNMLRTPTDIKIKYSSVPVDAQGSIPLVVAKAIDETWEVVDGEFKPTDITRFKLSLKAMASVYADRIRKKVLNDTYSSELERLWWPNTYEAALRIKHDKAYDSDIAILSEEAEIRGDITLDELVDLIIEKGTKNLRVGKVIAALKHNACIEIDNTEDDYDKLVEKIIELAKNTDEKLLSLSSSTTSTDDTSG